MSAVHTQPVESALRILELRARYLRHLAAVGRPLMGGDLDDVAEDLEQVHQLLKGRIADVA